MMAILMDQSVHPSAFFLLIIFMFEVQKDRGHYFVEKETDNPSLKLNSST